MRLYGTKDIRNTMNQRMESRSETRDAILWEIDSSNRRCRVKIQGSDRLVTVFYPLNWRLVPEFLRIGNAVKIMHTGGARGRLEIVGDGGLVPTAVPGGSGTAPGSLLADTVISGLLIKAFTDPTMHVYITPGSFRYASSVYSVWNDEIMGGETPFGSGTVMGAGDTILTIAAASTSQFRYDNIVIGIDGVPDVVQGTYWDGFEDMTYPATPANHIHLGYVLVPPNTTAIDGHLIYATFSSPIASQILITSCKVAGVESTDLHENSAPAGGGSIHTDNTASITVKITDQYDNSVNRGILGVPYQITAEIYYGNGLMSYSTQSGTSVTVASTSGEVTFTYTKAEYPGCVTSFIKFSCPDVIGETYQQLHVWSETLQEMY